MIAIGKHTAICRSIQFGEASTGNKQLVAEFEITGDDEDAGGSISAFLFFTEKTFDRTIESLRYMGWTGDDLAELPALAESGGMATEVEIVVDHEPYKDTVNAKIKWINRIGGGRIKLEKPIEGNELRSFAAQMKGRIGAGPPPRKPASNGRSAGYGGARRDDREVPSPVDDDLPW